MSTQIVARDVGAGDFIRVDGHQYLVHVKSRPVGGEITFQVMTRDMTGVTEVTYEATEPIDIISQWPTQPGHFGWSTR